MTTQETIINDAANSLLENMLAGNSPQIEEAAKDLWELHPRKGGWSDADPAAQRQAVLITIEAVAHRLKSISYATGVCEGSA